MANYRNDFADVNLETGTICRNFMNHSIGSGDALGDRFGVRVFRNGEPVSLGGTVAGYFVRNTTGETVVISSGVVSGNEAYVTLPAACYAVEGSFTLAIKVTSGSETVTMRIVDGVVSRTNTSVTVDPGTLVPSIETLISAINSAVGQIPVNYNASFAPAYSASSTYAVGDYVVYDGYLWRCTTAITETESWTAAHWTKVALASDVSDLKSALEDTTGNNLVQFVNNKVINTSVSPVNINATFDSQTMRYAVIDVSAGDVFTINGTGTTAPRLWCFIDSSNVVISRADENATETNLVLIAPLNASKLIIQTKLTDHPSYYGNILINKTMDIKKDMNQLTHNVGYAYDTVDLTKYAPMKGIYNSHAISADSTRVITSEFINVAGATAIRVTVPSGYRYAVIGFVDNDLAATTKLWTDWQTAANLYFLKDCNYILIEINNTNESSTAISDMENVDVDLINRDVFDNTIAGWAESEALNGDNLINFYQGCKYGSFNGTTWTTNAAFLSTDYIDVKNQRTVIVKNTKYGLKAEYFFLDGNKALVSGGYIDRTTIGDQFAIDVTNANYIVIVFRKSDETAFGNADAFDYIKIVSSTDSETVTEIKAQNNFVRGVIVDGDVSTASSRLVTKKFIDVTKQSIVGITVSSGYYFGLAFYTSASLAGFVRQVQWIQGTGEEMLFDVSYYNAIRVQLRRSDNADMSVSEGSAMTKLRGISNLMGMEYGLKETINSVKEYEGERISINPSLNWYPIVNSVEGTGISYTTYPQQGAAQHNGTLFLFRDGGKCVSFDLKTLKKIDAFEISDIVSDNPHNNCASFGNEYPSDNDDYPYLYLSRCTASGEEPASERMECYVLNITESSASVVQKIRYNVGSWIVDNERNRLIGYEHTDGENGVYIFKEFALPAVTTGTIDLTDADIIDSWEVRRDVFNHQFGAVQGWTVSGKYIIGCVSNPTINEEQLIVFDKYEHRMVACYVWSKSITDETQQAVVYNGALYIVSELARIDKVIFN